MVWVARLPGASCSRTYQDYLTNFFGRYNLHIRQIDLVYLNCSACIYAWRLGLERAISAENAVDIISELVGRHGLTGQASDSFPSVSVSLLICDRLEAWILEAAGKHFAAARVKSRTTATGDCQLSYFFLARSHSLLQFFSCCTWTK
jgi:hypothetical protein